MTTATPPRTIHTPYGVMTEYQPKEPATWSVRLASDGAGTYLRVRHSDGSDAVDADAAWLRRMLRPDTDQER